MKRLLSISMAFIAALSLLSCAETGRYYPDSPLDQHWGWSVETLKQNQMANPETAVLPETPARPVTGFDPKAGEMVIKKYRETFEKSAERQGQRFDFTTQED